MDNILEKINKSSLKFLVPLTPEETYQTIVHEAIKLVKADEGFILLKENGELRKVYASSNVIWNVKIRKQGYAYRAYKKREAFVVDVSDLKKVDPISAKAGVKSILFLPLSYKNNSIGVLVVRSYKNREVFNDSDLKLLHLYSSMASLAIRKTQLYDETKRALTERDLFISLAAHELRTPLTTLSGYIQLIQKKMFNTNLPEKKWVAEVYIQTMRLSKLINELLDISRIKTGKFVYNFEECDFKKILEQAVDGFKVGHPDRKIQYKTSIKQSNASTIGDSNKLVQVITNILENAHKFSSKDNSIWVSFTNSSSFYTVRITDKGTGILKEDMAKIFESFYKGAHGQHQGMGLGLYLAKTIIDAHHGTISVMSKLNKGTSVEIKLPISKI